MLYTVKWQAGTLASGVRDYKSLPEAQEFFVECVNQLYGDGGKAMQKGTAWVKLEQDGIVIINTAQEAARL